MIDQPTHIDILETVIGAAEGIFAFIFSVLTAIAGFIIARVWSHSETLATVKQELNDSMEMVKRLHAENLSWRDEVIRRLDRIDNEIKELSHAIK
jgi:hypothetical protein